MELCITYDEWEKKYKPRYIKEAGEGKQLLHDDGTPAYTCFDTTKDDYDFMMKYAKPNTVWTERYDENDTPYMTSGVGLVNRLSFYVTEVSHEGKAIIVEG